MKKANEEEETKDTVMPLFLDKKSSSTPADRIAAGRASVARKSKELLSQDRAAIQKMLPRIRESIRKVAILSEEEQKLKSLQTMKEKLNQSRMTGMMSFAKSFTNAFERKTQAYTRKSAKEKAWREKRAKQLSIDVEDLEEEYDSDDVTDSDSD